MAWPARRAGSPTSGIIASTARVSGQENRSISARVATVTSVLETRPNTVAVITSSTPSMSVLIRDSRSPALRRVKNATGWSSSRPKSWPRSLATMAW